MLRRLAFVGLLSLPASAFAQVPAGGEFRVNSYTSAGQYDPSVAFDARGAFVVTWSSDGQDESARGVFGQRFDAAGALLGAEFRVNTYTTSSQGRSAIAVDGNGNFVVAWHSVGQDGSGLGIYGQRFTATGAPRGAEFRINTVTFEDQLFPAVASAPDASFVVLWESDQQDGSGAGIFGQRFSSSGTSLGGEFRVNTYTTGYQVSAAAAMDAAGNFVVVWENRSGQDGDIAGVFGQRFTAAGAPAGAEFLVNSYTTFNQMLPAIAVVDGGFVVTWESYRQDGAGSGVFGQRFTAAGVPAGSEFRVNTYTTSEQRSPRVAPAGGGGFAVAWHSFGQDASGFGVFGQRFDAAGARVGAEFRVNTYTTGYQLVPWIAADPAGNFVVAWESAGSDGSSFGVAAQRFGGLLPAAAGVDTTGNNVLEPGESVDLRPSWRNANGAAQTFAGVLSNITGPTGATYAITDGSGNYGTVANGATGACLDCYGIAVSNPPTRPATHWDASVVESITPGAQGQQKRWALHVGTSFTDVPDTNPFYRFVETLLHHSVTGGCGAGIYCPASSTTREQMAVFVLVAREGVGYTPPACGTPVFNDVPASSGFCRWIEELARRGVVSGCGSGNYCPASAATREQMAVFVLRTLDAALDPPACTTPVFGDVPASSPFCRWIEELARRGVVSGCGGGNYCPAAPVTREQMGAFLGVTFGLTLYGP